MKTQSPTLGRTILAGFISGVIGAVLANLALLILERQIERSFPVLNWFSVARASIISSLIGAFVYQGLVRWTKRPVVWFWVLGMGVAVLDSVMLAAHPPEAGIARVANPLHFVVAITALLLIPALAPAFPEPERGAARRNPPPVPSKS